MDKPCEIEAHLLAIVVFDDIERLHIVKESRCQHTRDQSVTIVHPTAVNLTTLGHVYGEMLQDNISFHKVFKLKISVKCLSYDLLLLTCIESNEHITGVIYERLLAIVVLKSNLNFEFLAHHINLWIVKEDNNSDLLLFLSFSFVKVFYLFDFIVDTVKDTFLLNEGFKLE